MKKIKVSVITYFFLCVLNIEIQLLKMFEIG